MAPHLAGFCREQRKFQNSTNALVSLSVTLFGKDEPSDDPGRPGEPPPTTLVCPPFNSAFQPGLRN